MDKICDAAYILVEYTSNLHALSTKTRFESLLQRNYAHLLTEMFDTVSLILKQVTAFLNEFVFFHIYHAFESAFPKISRYSVIEDCYNVQKYKIQFKNC